MGWASASRIRSATSTEPGGGVGVPDQPGDAARHLDEQPVAGRVSHGVVDRLEPVQVDEQQRHVPAVPVTAGQREPYPLGEQRAVGQPGQLVRQRLVLVEPPGEDVRHRGGQHERPVDPGPQPRVALGRAVVVHGARRQHPDDAVVQHDEQDRETERHPVLVQRDDADHDEEVEVHLDVAAGQVHQHRGRRDEAERRRRGPQHPAVVAHQRDRAARPDRGHVGERVQGAVVGRETHHEQRGYVQPHQDRDAAMARVPPVVGERAAARQQVAECVRAAGERRQAAAGQRRRRDKGGGHGPNVGASGTPT
jgi:hypothetical protein